MKFFIMIIIAVGAYARMIDAVAAIVANEPITLYDIDKRMQESRMDRKSALESLIRQKLEAMEIKKRHIEVNEEEVYAEIRRLAAANNMSIGEFYDVVRETNGLRSSELKEKIKKRLLAQKLYQAIALSKMNEPSDTELKEYYRLHEEEFVRPAFFDVVVYSAPDKSLLEQKRNNPMFYSPNIAHRLERLDPSRLNPQLARLLEKTGEGQFSVVLPNGRNGFMVFYVEKIGKSEVPSFEALKQTVLARWMQEKRAAILDDYFTKLKDKEEVKILRTDAR